MLQLELSLQTEKKNQQEIKTDVPNVSEIEKLTE